MKKKGTKALIVTVMALLLSVFSISANDVSVDGAHMAAVNGLPELLNASPLMQSYSMTAKSSVTADKNSSFQVFTINPDALVAGDVRKESIQATPLYCFLVKQKSHVIGLTTVEKIKGEWKILTFGGAQMAAEVHQIFSTYPAKDGYTTRYLRSYQSFSDYFEIYKDGIFQGIVPLSSGRTAMDLENKAFNPKEMFQKNQVFSSLGSKVMDNLEAYSQSK